MPHDFAVAQYAHGSAVFLKVRDNRDFGRQVEKLVGGALLELFLVQLGRAHRRTEALHEANEIIRGHRLAAKYEVQVIEPRVVDFRERRVVELRDVDAADLRAERRVRRHDFQRRGFFVGSGECSRHGHSSSA